jgi:hypothetical protein
MPWFPDFVNAAELARKQTRAAGQADPVGQYIAALDKGETGPLETTWPGHVTVYDPRAGEVRGHRELRHFIRDSQNLLAAWHARTETVASTVAGDRAVVELMAHVTVDGQEHPWPAAIVADSADDRSVTFRTYLSLWVLDGQHHSRPPILRPGTAPAQPGGIVGRYQAALAAGDTDAIVATFTPGGYVQEPLGPPHAHRGQAELRGYFTRCFSDGGIALEPCRVTDDGTRCALEYNLVRWGRDEMPPQAGLAVFERSPDGLLAAARIYDDIAAPPGTAPGPAPAP